MRVGRGVRGEGRGKLLAVASALVLVGNLAAREADASSACESAPGVLPAKAVMFLPAIAEPGRSWSWSGPRVTASTPSAGVVRLDLDFEGTAATELLLGVNGRNRRGYPVDLDWRPRTRPPRVTQTLHVEEVEVCVDDYISIRVDDAVAAFRVTWTFDGRTTHAIALPQRGCRDSTSVLLGMVGCTTLAIAPAELHAGTGTLDLVAIRHDGSEVPVEGLPHPFAIERDEPATHEDDDDIRTDLAALACLAAAYAAYRAWLARDVTSRAVSPRPSTPP
ncbi:MAG: hypothetical protein KIT31_07260 [Deltaproteobacteria bacterium]|nr:hypothetical protein [Deltaproteobacteria bacterium]